MTAPERDTTSRAQAVALLVLQALLSWGIYSWVCLELFVVAGCGDWCNYALISAASRTIFLVCIGGPVVSVIGITILYLRGKRSAWLPAAGIALVILVGIGATIGINVGTAP